MFGQALMAYAGSIFGKRQNFRGKMGIFGQALIACGKDKKILEKR
jgi:hypothetical protein